MKKSIKLAFVSLMFAVGFAAGFSLGFVKPIEVSYAANSEPTTSEVQEPAKSSWIEDKIIPIVSGFSVANLVGIAISIASALAKSRMDKKLKDRIESQKEQIVLLEATVTALASEYAKLTSTFAENKEALDTFQQTASELLKVIEERNLDIVDVVKMKEIIAAICDLVSKALALSDAAVKSGIAKDAQRLVLNLTGGSTDNGER